MRLRKETITLGLGIACIVGIIPLAANAAVSSHEKIKDVEWNEGPMPTKEKIKLVWKDWIPPVLMAGLAITNVCMSHSYMKKGLMAAETGRLAAISMANTAQTGYNAYRQKMIDEVGKEVHDKVTQELAEEKTHDITVGNDMLDNMIVYGDSSQGEICFDAMTGRYFYTTEDKLKNACAEINIKLGQAFDATATINDFYNELCLPETKFGDVMGWTLGADGRNRMFLDIHGCPKLTPNGRSCLEIEYNWELLYDHM